MNIAPPEMREIANINVHINACSAHTPTPAPRVDLYAGVHKALRAFMADTLLAVGRMDSEDPQELRDAGERVRALLDTCQSHLQHENTFVHAAMEARAPGASAAIANEHAEHERDIPRLAQAVDALLAAGPEWRAAHALALYRQLSLFIAHNFEHMHVEETAHNAVLWARYTDAELLQIEAQIVASIAPEKMMTFLRWMVPYMNPQERSTLLGGMQAQAPAAVFAAVVDAVRPHLRTGEWQKLAANLGLTS